MIIGIDAGSLSVSDERLKVGVYKVVFNLIREITHQDTKNEYRLYSFAPLDRGLMDSFGRNAKNIVLKPAKGWLTLRLPLELKFHPVDVFLGTAQALPLSSSYNIGFIYDLGFLHVPSAYPDSYQRLKNQTKDVVARSKHIVTISNNSKDDIAKTYEYPVEQITVAYPGVDNIFVPRGEVHKGTNPYFLLVGALKPGKNVPFALRAFSQFMEVSKKEHDLYLIGGDYWKDPEIEKTIHLLGLTDRVKMIGFIPDKKLPSYYRAAVALLVTSSWEGFCLPLAEAMACGCVVVGVKNGAVPEIAGSAAVLVDGSHEHNMARAMLQVTQKSFLKRKMIQEGILQAKKYAWEKFGKSVIICITSRK